MKGHPRLSKTGIEYCINPDGSKGYAWNLYSGCWHKAMGICPPDTPCWAEQITKRFKDHYPNGFEPTFYPAEAFLSPLKIKKPSRILVCFMGDLFGEWVDPEHVINGVWTVERISTGERGIVEAPKLKNFIHMVINACPQHTFIFLTKNPAGLNKWSPFPANCWVGASVVSNGTAPRAYYGLYNVKASVRFISFEPLLGQIGRDELRNLSRVSSWWIIGQQTPVSEKTAPRIEWIKEIVDFADEVGIPVFLKNNLWRIFYDESFEKWRFAHDSKHGWLRQEFPLKKQSEKSGVVYLHSGI